MQPQTHTDCMTDGNAKSILFYFIVKKQYFNILIIL